MANFRADPIVTETLTPVSGASANIILAGKTFDVSTPGAAVSLAAGAPAAVTGSDPSLGIFWVSSSTPTTPYFRQSDGTDLPLSQSTLPARGFWKHTDWPEGTDQGGNTIQYIMWWPVTSSIVSVQAYMSVTNSNGTYGLTVTNDGDSVLASSEFDMNTLGNDTLNNLALTSSADYKQFDPYAKMIISLSSSDDTFDGTGTYLSFFAEEV
jgi:hypothetical protein